MNKRENKEVGEKMNMLDELRTFRNELIQYANTVTRYLKGGLTEEEKKQGNKIHNTISQKVGYLGSFISELSGISNVDVNNKEFGMWLIAFRIPADEFADSALGVCLLATNQALGKLEYDIKKGIRDEQGNLTREPSSAPTKPPKAFIAHGGKSEARDKLCRFLTALNITPLIVEEQSSENRSVGENVDHYARQCDFAIILATKGDIDGKTGKFIPRGNVLIEIGKSQELFKNRIIYLLQAGVKLPSDINEKVRARFTSENMDEAFITISRELTKFGILKANKPPKE